MKIAVLTLTRDRLEYTRHCFETLRQNAGCDFDHYVLDQGSTDGTEEWLTQEFQSGQLNGVRYMGENVGIHRGLNWLLDFCIDVPDADYDVVVKFDNDCELLQPHTLKDVADAVYVSDTLLSPRIHGLRNPPGTIREFQIGAETILETSIIGGIFLAAPARLYTELEYRFDENGPIHGEDDATLCAWWRNLGGRVGYVKRLAANHYETTDGQVERYPWYFERRVLEGGRAR